MYPLPVDFLKLAFPEMKKPHKGIMNILAGNSGDESNRHAETLQTLEFLKDSDIRIFCPLSYSGNPDYKNTIVRTGKKIFGEKFIPVTEILEPPQYLMLLSDIDIAVMNHKRQQGLGNILPLLYFGKKVYLRNDTTSSEYLRSIGCTFYNSESIIPDTADFLSFDRGSLAENTKIIRNLLSEENCRTLWIPILNTPVLS
jgi:hypothetical protein